MLQKRFFSFLIDYFIVIPLSMILTAIMLFKTGLCKDTGLLIFTTVFVYINPIFVFNMPMEVILSMIFCVVFPAITVYCTYCLLTELCFRKTIGQKIIRIMYVNQEGKQLLKKEIVIRNILKYISLILGLVGIISVPISKGNKPVYDILLKIDIVQIG